jgi:hypothetical protein
MIGEVDRAIDSPRRHCQVTRLVDLIRNDHAALFAIGSSNVKEPTKSTMNPQNICMHPQHTINQDGSGRNSRRDASSLGREILSQNISRLA